MIKSARLLAALGAGVVVAVGVGGCGGGLPNDAVAEVGSVPITKATFDHWVRIATAAAVTATDAAKAPTLLPPNYSACIEYLRAKEAKPAKGKAATSQAKLKDRCAEDYSTVRQTTLSFLISTQWLIGEAADLGVKATDKEVEKEFATIKKEDYPTEASFRKYLARTGYTISDLLLKTKVEDVLPAKIEAKIVSGAETSVSKADVANYYDRHKSGFHRPESKGTLILLTTTEAQAKAAKSEIQSGQSFAAVAKRVSILHTSQQGGDYMTAARGREEKALETAVFAAKIHALSGPLKTSSGYYIYEVQKTLPGVQESLSKAEGAIRQALKAKKVEAALSDFATAHERKWRAKTSCRTGYIISECKQYVIAKATTSTTG